MSLTGHFWTVAPYARQLLRAPRSPASRQFLTSLTDPLLGELPVTGRLSEKGDATELAVLIHGMGGNCESGYVLQATEGLLASGFSVLRLNLRGSDRASADHFHAGLTADLHAALGASDLARYRQIFIVGFSLGGHVALRWATEAGDDRVVGVAGVCAPLDLQTCQRYLDGRGRWLYRRHILSGLKEIYAAIHARRELPTPLDVARRARTIREWDRLVVCPRFGFDTPEDYYARAAVAPRLNALRVPALLVAAPGDPLVPASSIRPYSAPRLEVRWTDRGGHCAFPSRFRCGDETTSLTQMLATWSRSLR